MFKLNAILAMDKNYGIGKNNGLPWPHHEEDMKWFKENTNGHAILMGRKTWDSLGNKPLPNRSNFILTRNYEALQKSVESLEKVTVLNGTVDINQTINYLKNFFDTVWIIGGAELYKATIPLCNNLYVTEFKTIYDCDTYIPYYLFDGFVKLASKPGVNCEFSIWSKM